MPLFGKSKKTKDAKKQEEAPAPKPAAYRHVPKHAASDARNHGLSESDRAAQQKRIMAASQSRLNSMNSNYSIKSNFDEVPINGSQSKPYFITASNSPRHSIGSAKGKDRPAVQPGSPAGTAQPTHKAMDDYAKLRSPSLLSNVTLPGNSTPKPILAVKNKTSAGGIGSSDSGYGSVGQISRPDSKAPSTISKAPSEPSTSQDVRNVPRPPTGLDFLPKLDFTPESSRPTTASEQAASPIYAKPPGFTASRDRAISSSSSYISRLDPGSDRRSVASFQSKPFDQIDFSRPEQQFVPPAFTANNRKEPGPVAIARQTIQSEAKSPQLVREPKKDRGVPESTTPEPVTQRESPIQPDIPREAVPQPNRSAEAPPEPARHTVPDAALLVEGPTERSNQDDAGSQSMPDQMTDQKVGDAPTPVYQEEKVVQPHTKQAELLQPQQSNPADCEGGRRTPQSVAAPVSAAEHGYRDASSLQSGQSEDTQSRSTRHRNWSRPSLSSGSHLDYAMKESNAGASDALTQPAAPVLPEKIDQGDIPNSRETGFDARDFSRTEQVQPSTRNAQIEAPQSQAPHRWNDQASSIYGDSSYNPSTRQHSPSRRQSFAPSELLEVAHPAGRSVLPPLSILDGLKVNKRGKILDEEGDAIGELVEGDIIDCVRQKANAFGQVCDDYGRIVGRVTTLSGGGDVRSQSPATTVRSRGFSDFRPDPTQRYALPESQIVNPATPTLAKPFEYKQEEDPRERAAKLQAAAARRNTREPVAQIELDGSGMAEAAPLVDHSEIFAPPFIPSRSPKRSPAEPAPNAMDYYFANPLEKSQPTQEEGPRLKTWASRNLEPEREEMQNARQGPPAPISQPPSEHNVSRPSTRDEPPAERNTAVIQNEPDTAARNFISSDQPKDIFPWMTGSAPQENAKWNPNVFTYKDRGEVPNENANRRQSAASVRSIGAQSQNQSAFTGNSASPKQYAAHSAPSAGSRKSKRTSFQHQPHVKSPLSTHTVTPPDTSTGLTASSTNDTTPRSSSRNTTISSTSAATDTTLTADPSNSPEQQRKKTYFTHAGRTSVMVPDTTPTHTAPTQTVPESSTVTDPPPSPLDPAVPPDVVRMREGGKKKSRWSMGFDFGRKTPPVQNLLKKG